MTTIQHDPTCNAVLDDESDLEQRSDGGICTCGASVMTPDPKALAVLLDAARACYGDDSEQVRWLLNPDAVRELISHAPTSYGGERCEPCDAPFMEESHFRACAIAAAWRALGDPRGAADIERAHEEALRAETTRARIAPLWTTTEANFGPPPRTSAVAARPRLT